MQVDQLRQHLAALFPDYVGLLLYGGRASGTLERITGDWDLVVVTRTLYSPRRFHSERVDLNILPLSALQAVLQRLLANEERPWDGMFAQIQLLDTTSAELDQIVRAISLAYSGKRSPEASEIDALRYSVSRTIGDVESASPPLGLHLITGQAISAILFAWTAVVGRRWSGLRDALRQLSVSEPLQVQRFEAVIRETHPQQRLLMLRELESWVFRTVGGAWRDEVLVLKTGIDAGQTRSGSIAMTDEQRMGLQRFLLDPPGGSKKPSV